MKLRVKGLDIDNSLNEHVLTCIRCGSIITYSFNDSNIDEVVNITRRTITCPNCGITLYTAINLQNPIEIDGDTTLTLPYVCYISDGLTRMDIVKVKSNPGTDVIEVTFEENQNKIVPAFTPLFITGKGVIYKMDSVNPNELKTETESKNLLVSYQYDVYQRNAYILNGSQFKLTKDLIKANTPFIIWDNYGTD